MKRLTWICRRWSKWPFFYHFIKRWNIEHSSLCSDSPVLWIRLDPEMIIARSVIIEQPDFQWQFQLRHERDVTAQLDAIAALEKYATPATRMALTDTIENPQCFHSVRCKAAQCLTKVMSQWTACSLVYSFSRWFLGGHNHDHHMARSSSDVGNISEIFRFIQCTAHHQTKQFLQLPALLFAEDNSRSNGRPANLSRHMSVGSVSISFGFVQVQRQLAESLLGQLLSSRAGGRTRPINYSGHFRCTTRRTNYRRKFIGWCQVR